ncbi:MAG: hypothetical protein ABL935_06380 [Nitrospiraceae bacterium]|nr:hypothetical protein [Nitrospira sp.]
MTRETTKHSGAMMAVLVLGLVWFLGIASDVGAVPSNSDYASQPPFIADAVTPNVLVMFDNSGTMGYRAYCGGQQDNDGTPYTNCQTIPAQYVNGAGAAISSPLPTGAPFVETVTFKGLFDPMRCYTYDSGQNRFVYVATGKAAIDTACGGTEWDGNLLNYITYRRHDALKQAFIGAQCAVARTNTDPLAACPPSGSPLAITMKNDNGTYHTCCDDNSTHPIAKGACTLSLPGTVSCANGRVPSVVQSDVGGVGQPLVFHLRGSGTLNGSFCVTVSTSNPPANGANSCTTTPTGSSTGGKFVVRFTVPTEPTGLIQSLGAKARFGLLEFRQNTTTNDGGIVVVPIGSNQSRPYDATTVTTYANNLAAMIVGIEQAGSSTYTPLAETLYTGIRYIAQLPQPFGVTGSYLYPCAFSGCGPSFQAGQTAGGLGTSEINVMKSGETCASTAPSAGYITSACGRDPYFIGADPFKSNLGSPTSYPSPNWVSSSAQVTCCKTFILFLTDGEANSDNNLPSTIDDYAHLSHGNNTHCTGSFSPTTPSPTAAAYTGGSGCWRSQNPIAPDVLLKKHRSDYNLLDTSSPNINKNHSLDDIAFWGHVTDLRAATVAGIAEAGRDVPGFQNITLYSVFAFGDINGRELVMQAAKQGGFEDTNNDNLGPGGVDTPDIQADWDRVNNDTGLPGADGFPDTYFEAQNADDIKGKLTSALISLLQKAASGTAVSVLATSATGEGALYQSYFFPSRLEVATGADVKWTGYTQGLFLDLLGNLREDTNQDGRLVYDQDKIIKTRYDTTNKVVLVDKYRDTTPIDGKADDINGTSGKICNGIDDCDGDGIFPPADTDDADDTIPGERGLALTAIAPIWEAGRRLALTDAGATCAANSGGVNCRRLITWVDGGAGDGKVQSSEVIDFDTTNSPTLGPYLQAEISPSVYTADNLINFIRGVDPQISGLRDRRLTVTPDTGPASLKVWKLGDPIHSTPSVVGAPKERYDVLYGDATYANFFKQYRNRRQVAYMGANDGMLHAFNAGFYHAGDDTSVGAPAGVTEHGWFSTAPDGLLNTGPGPLRSSTLPVGAEMWGFIPYQLLPHLKWLARPDYQHVYYVDLKPKITDARIFTPDADHPDGWGTVLIGGFRMGGSCGNCELASGGKPMVVNIGGTDRYFYSAYFAMDVTNPEKDPQLLWIFSDVDQGFTTSYPSIVRVNPAGSAKTDNTNAKWFVVVGSGPSGYGGTVARADEQASGFPPSCTPGPGVTCPQKSKVYVLNLATGPTTLSPAGSVLAATFTPGSFASWIGDTVSVDKNFDYRADAVYMGRALTDGSNPWTGKFYRLTTGDVSASSPAVKFGEETDPTDWGYSNDPTEMLASFPASNALDPGPILTAPALALDDAANLWVFFGTGRYYTNGDKTNTDPQYFFGIKDSVLSGACSQTSSTSCLDNDLVNVSAATVCSVCAGNQVTDTNNTGVTTLLGTTTNTLQGLVQSKDGWYTNLPFARERVLATPVVLGGVVFFPSFIPLDDVCQPNGDGRLYALFYLTGSAHTSPVIGTAVSGGNTNNNRSISLGSGTGMASGLAIHIGGQGSGGGGSTSGAGCQGGVTGFLQSSTGTLSQYCTKPVGSVTSRYLSWMSQRE